MGKGGKMKRLTLMGILLITVILFPASFLLNSESEGPIEEWIAEYNGPGNGQDYAVAIAVDSEGNVYVTGYGYGIETGLDYATIKYDKNGNQLWVARYDGPRNYSDIVHAIAVDPRGNVYVTGRSYGNWTSYDYAAIKYDKNGNQLWVARYNGPGNKGEVANALAVDPAGSVYVTGYSIGSGTSFDYLTIKYDKKGNQLWVERYDGPANYNDIPFSLAVDPVGNVYVTGQSYGVGTGFDYLTIKYSQKSSKKNK